jgi:hypothetical protein
VFLAQDTTLDGQRRLKAFPGAAGSSLGCVDHRQVVQVGRDLVVAGSVAGLPVGERVAEERGCLVEAVLAGEDGAEDGAVGGEAVWVGRGGEQPQGDGPARGRLGLRVLAAGVREAGEVVVQRGQLRCTGPVLGFEQVLGAGVVVRRRRKVTGVFGEDAAGVGTAGPMDGRNVGPAGGVAGRGQRRRRLLVAGREPQGVAQPGQGLGKPGVPLVAGRQACPGGLDGLALSAGRGVQIGHRAGQTGKGAQDGEQFGRVLVRLILQQRVGSLGPAPGWAGHAVLPQAEGAAVQPTGLRQPGDSYGPMNDSALHPRALSTQPARKAGGGQWLPGMVPAAAGPSVAAISPAWLRR